MRVLEQPKLTNSSCLKVVGSTFVGRSFVGGACVTLGDRRTHAQTEYSVNPRTESSETYCVCRIPSVFSMQFKKKKKPCKLIEELGWWGGWRWCWGGGGGCVLLIWYLQHQTIACVWAHDRDRSKS